MPTNYNSLLVSGATGWHDGSQNILYSFLGSTVPSYYPVAAGEVDLGSALIPEGTNVQMTAGEQALSLLAVQAWNAVANINLTPGTISGTGGGGGSGGTTAPITGTGALVSGLGGTTDFGELVMPRNDDGSTSVDISAVFEDGLNFFGNTFSSMFVNTNGNISFNSGISAYTPTGITGATSPLIAAFWADVDTRTNGLPDSEPIYVDIDPVADVVTITWANVGYYSYGSNLLNSFQMQLYDRGGGDFDIVFRYADINWTTGSASGGTGGLGGTPARAGYSAGNGTDFFELSQSGNQAGMLALENTAGNTGVQGLWVFQVRNGEVAVGDITFGAADMGDPSLFGFVSDFTGTLGTASNHGDLWINRGNVTQDAAAYGNSGWQTYLHELGHALGLHHPNEDPNNTAGDPTNNNQYTVMSYVAHPNEPSGDPVSDLNASWPITPMLYDIQALQALYGANFSTNTGNTTYFGPGGQFALDDNGRIAGSTLTAMATIWDAGGIDTFDFSNQTGALNIDLYPGHFSSIGAIAENIAVMTVVRNAAGLVVNIIENAWGGSGSDQIRGNTANNQLLGNAGNDSVWGFGGGDTLEGGGGQDILQGGAGNDSLLGGAGNDSLLGHGNNDTIDGGAGTDTISGGLGLDSISGGGDADLINGDAGADTIFGGNGNDTIYGGANADVIYGDADNDHIYGGSAKDVMTGGLGADTFFFGLNDFGTNLRAGADRITDFNQSQADRIDLSVIDARPAFAGNNAFTWLGTGAFTNTQGQLRYVQESGNTYVEGDRNGDGVADFAIRLDGLITLAASDFVL